MHGRDPNARHRRTQTDLRITGARARDADLHAHSAMGRTFSACSVQAPAGLLSLSLTLTALVRARRRSTGATRDDRRAHAPVDADGRLRADVLGRSRRPAVPRDLPLRPGAALPDVAAGRSRLQPDRPRPRTDGRDGRRHVPARRAEGPADPGQLPLPRVERGRRRAPGRRRLVRALGAVGLQGRSRRGRTRARRRDRLPAARRARRRRAPAQRQPGRVPRRREPHARSTCRARRPSRRTAKSRPSSRSPPMARPGELVSQVAPTAHRRSPSGSITRSCSCPTWRRTRSGRASPTRARAAST